MECSRRLNQASCISWHQKLEASHRQSRTRPSEECSYPTWHCRGRNELILTLIWLAIPSVTLPSGVTRRFESSLRQLYSASICPTICICHSKTTVPVVFESNISIAVPKDWSESASDGLLHIPRRSSQSIAVPILYCNISCHEATAHRDDVTLSFTLFSVSIAVRSPRGWTAYNSGRLRSMEWFLQRKELTVHRP